MFILKSTHKKAMADIFALTKEAIDEVKKRAESDHTINQRALDAERSITVSLRAEIEELRPAADKWNAAAKKRLEARKVSK